MDKYLEDLSVRLESETEPIFQAQIAHYDAFIRSLIQTNKILARRFYLVVPFSTTESGHMEFAMIKEQLGFTADLVSKGLNRLGMQTRQLSSLEVLDLFYSFYSPAAAKLQPLSERALEIIHTALIQKGAHRG